MSRSIADIFCPNCGAPARYDIISGRYICSYCGGSVGLSEAMAMKKGFRSIQQRAIRQSAENRRLLRASCSGCGAELVFEEGEAMNACAFCGRALVRENYLASEDLPELIIPFRITRGEAVECLLDWCRNNRGKPESRHLKENVDRLEGVYLPYELVRGPVSSSVNRMDGTRKFHCSGYVDNVFVNCSSQLNNLLLDGAEPFELDELRPFDFSYAAGQRVKIADIDAGELTKRVDSEVSNDYAPVVRKTLETAAVEVSTDASSVLRMPVLLPVYYICAGGTLAAVNGQTGKVSVQAEKDSHYYFLPWWLKAILSTLLIGGAAFAAFRLFGMEAGESLYVSAMLTLVTFVVTLAAFSDTVKNKVRVKAGRKIFTSAGGPLRRVDGKLVQDAKPIEKEITPPVFFETLEGRYQPVKLVFGSPLRRARMALIALAALFLPVIIALFLNGFDFARLTLGGSAVWFCIAVPTLPIYILKFGVIDLYDHPWIYILSPDGKKRRWRGEKKKWKFDSDILTTILGVLFIPPLSLAVWFGIICFCVMCYLTAFGFD